MDNQYNTEGFGAELQRLREVIPYAQKHGAKSTNISIELLGRLLDMHDDKANEAATVQGALMISQEDVEHLLHARTEITRVSVSPRRIRLPLAQKITAMLAPAVANMAKKVAEKRGASTSAATVGQACPPAAAFPRCELGS